MRGGPVGGSYESLQMVLVNMYKELAVPKKSLPKKSKLPRLTSGSMLPFNQTDPADIFFQRKKLTIKPDEKLRLMFRDADNKLRKKYFSFFGTMTVTSVMKHGGFQLSMDDNPLFDTAKEAMKVPMKKALSVVKDLERRQLVVFKQQR